MWKATFFLSVFQDFLEKQIHISLKNEDNKQSTIVSAKTTIVSLDIHSFSLYGEINIKLDYASLWGEIGSNQESLKVLLA